MYTEADLLEYSDNVNIRRQLHYLKKDHYKAILMAERGMFNVFYDLRLQPHVVLNTDTNQIIIRCIDYYEAEKELSLSEYKHNKIILNERYHRT